MGSFPSDSSLNWQQLWQGLRAVWQQPAGQRYAALRAVLRTAIPYYWRRRAVQFVRSRFGLRTLAERVQAQLTPPPPPPVSSVEPRDFYEALTLLPHLPPARVKELLKQPLPASAPARPAVICLSIIDWSFRFQRPQQLMAQFAAQGHRVFYLNLSHFRSLHARPKYAVQPITQRPASIPATAELYELTVAAPHPLDLFNTVLSDQETAAVLATLDELRRDYDINDAIAYVMIPSWARVAAAAQKRWGWRSVYDCMDEWENFPRVQPEALALEKRLVQSCDLLVVTAQRLFDKWQPYQRPQVLARNATDYDFYAARCQPNELLPGIQHPVIGYFGALADWFDVDLLAAVARARPQYTFVLLGGVFDVDVSALQALPNVRLLGQQPYETMPQYLYHFDACIIPFKLNPITEATDPVKLYEYLSGGKPVVSVRLPELEPFREHVYLADDAASFAAQLDAALAENSPAQAAQRQAVARQHTWLARQQTVMNKLAEVTPRASIIIVTYNNLALTKLCLESVLRHTEYPNYEIIVVDNRSADETPAYLREMAARHPQIKIQLNQENYGFAKANNQGIALATGEFLVLLNNDTITPPGWLSRLLWHLRDPAIGLIGPLTNFVGNEAKLEVDYHTWAELLAFTRRHTWARQDEIADIHMLAMFCVAMRRSVYERIGPLDERFGIGMFEDDDYSLRVRQAGLRVICAADCFVHHFGQAAFGKLIERGTYNQLFDVNRRQYEAKWGVTWEPHQHAVLDYVRHVSPSDE